MPLNNQNLEKITNPSSFYNSYMGDCQYQLFVKNDNLTKLFAIPKGECKEIDEKILFPSGDLETNITEGIFPIKTYLPSSMAFNCVEEEIHEFEKFLNGKCQRNHWGKMRSLYAKALITVGYIHKIEYITDEKISQKSPFTNYNSRFFITKNKKVPGERFPFGHRDLEYKTECNCGEIKTIHDFMKNVSQIEFIDLKSLEKRIGCVRKDEDTGSIYGLF